MEEYDYLFKILLIGDTSVGKSSIFRQYIDNNYSEITIPTIGIDFQIKTIKIGDKYIKLQLWDTAGQERFKSITQSYFRGSHGIILVFDISNIDSFTNLQDWIYNINNYCDDNVNIILVGNKIDLKNSREVSYKEAKDFADSLGMIYIEVSAKNNIGINNIFEILTKNLIKDLNDIKNNLNKKLLDGGTSYISLNEFSKNKKTFCCNY